MADKDDASARRLKIEFDPEMSFGEILKSIWVLDSFYRDCGGDRLAPRFRAEDIEPTPQEERYSLLEGTQFADSDIELGPAECYSFVPRDEVCSTIERLVQDSHARRLLRELETRFPQDRYGEGYPILPTLNYLFYTAKDLLK